VAAGIPAGSGSGGRVTDFAGGATSFTAEHPRLGRCCTSESANGWSRTGDLVARASPAAHSHQLSASEKDKKTKQVSIRRRTRRSVTRSRGEQTVVSGRTSDFLSPCAEVATHSVARGCACASNVARGQHAGRPERVRRRAGDQVRVRVSVAREEHAGRASGWERGAWTARGAGQGGSAPFPEAGRPCSSTLQRVSVSRSIPARSHAAACGWGGRVLVEAASAAGAREREHRHEDEHEGWSLRQAGGWWSGAGEESRGRAARRLFLEAGSPAPRLFSACRFLARFPPDARCRLRGGEDECGRAASAAGAQRARDGHEDGWWVVGANPRYDPEHRILRSTPMSLP